MQGFQRFRGLELRHHVGQGEAVVGTHILADVAAVHPAVEGLRVEVVEAAFVFDGEIGETLAGVDAERSLQSAGGASIEAFRAAAAAVGQGLTGFGQFNGQEQVPDEEERAFFGVD